MLKLFSLLQYWKTGGLVLLVAGFLLSAHLASSRGTKLDAALKTLQSDRQDFQQQLTIIKKTRQDEKDRNTFRTKQIHKIAMAAPAPVAFDASLRDAYDRLRERQAGNDKR